MLLNNGKHIDLAPQGLAELVPQLVQGYYYPDGIGVQLERNFALYGELYRSQPWVYAVVNKRANAIARLPIAVWNEGGSTRQLDTSSGYAKLMADPCPGYLNSFKFWFWLQATRDIYGEAYLAIVRDRSTHKPIALLPMHPTRIAIKRDPDTGEYTYTFQAGAGYGDGLVQFKEADVVPFVDYNPMRLERGLSKLEPLRSTLMNEDSSRTAMAATWKNAGRPNVVLSTDKKLGVDGRKRLKESFDATHAGSSQAGQTMVLEDGLTAKALQMTATDLQWIDGRKLNREEVCGVFDLSPANVQILDHSTYSNVAQQLRSFYKTEMAPPIESMESVLDDYVGKYWQGTKVVRFSVDDVLRGDFEVRADAAARLATVGGLTPNEVRELMGYSRFEGEHDDRADRLYANAAMQPLGEPAERITLTGPVGHDPDGVALELPAPPMAGKPQAALPASAGNDGTDPAQLDNSSGDLPGATVATLDYRPQPKHLRAVKGALGRGLDVKEFAMKLAAKCPDDLEDILRAVEIAIAHRDSAA